MAKIIATPAPRNTPETASGELRGADLREVPEVASERCVARYIDVWYDLTRRAVDRWGGTVALAATFETAMSGVSDRLNRREVKGALQRGFIDYLAVVSTNPNAAEELLFGLCELFGFEPPKRKRLKTEREKYAALVRELHGAGELGGAAIRAAARKLGIDPSEFEPETESAS